MMIQHLHIPDDALAAFCTRWKVVELALFGSALRGDFGPGSDVDLLAEIDPDAGFSLLDLAGLQLDLGDVLGRSVHVATSLERARPRIRRRIEADLIEVF